MCTISVSSEVRCIQAKLAGWNALCSSQPIGPVPDIGRSHCRGPKTLTTLSFLGSHPDRSSKSLRSSCLGCLFECKQQKPSQIRGIRFLVDSLKPRPCLSSPTTHDDPHQPATRFFDRVCSRQPLFIDTVRSLLPIHPSKASHSLTFVHLPPTTEDTNIGRPSPPKAGDSNTADQLRRERKLLAERTIPSDLTRIIPPCLLPGFAFTNLTTP